MITFVHSYNGNIYPDMCKSEEYVTVSRSCDTSSGILNKGLLSLYRHHYHHCRLHPNHDHYHIMITFVHSYNGNIYPDMCKSEEYVTVSRSCDTSSGILNKGLLSLYRCKKSVQEALCIWYICFIGNNTPADCVVNHHYVNSGLVTPYCDIDLDQYRFR